MWTGIFMTTASSMIRQAFIILSAIVLFGFAVPWMKGFAFLDPLIIVSYACIGVLFIVPAAAEAASEPSPRSTVLSKTASLVAYGWSISVLMLISGILAVNFRSWHNQLITPAPRLLLAGLFLGASACLALIGATGLLSEKYGPKVAKSVVRTCFLAFLLLTGGAYRYLPDAWRSAIDESLTTAALTRFSFSLAMILTVVGVSLTAWRMKTPQRLGIQ